MGLAILHIDVVSFGECFKCGVAIYGPRPLYDACVKLGHGGQSFYCVNGHGQVFAQSEADRLRKRLEAEERRHNMTMSALDDEKKSARAYKGQVTKLKNRASAGLCLCCNRTFRNLARHMKSKHPGEGGGRDA